MSAQPTLGQWVVEPILDRFNVYTDDARCICIARDCTEGDARLIAAARDLLEACRAVLSANTTETRVQAAALCAAAIAKAEAAS